MFCVLECATIILVLCAKARITCTVTDTVLKGKKYIRRMDVGLRMDRYASNYIGLQYSCVIDGFGDATGT